MYDIIILSVGFEDLPSLRSKLILKCAVILVFDLISRNLLTGCSSLICDVQGKLPLYSGRFLTGLGGGIVSFVVSNLNVFGTTFRNH